MTARGKRRGDGKGGAPPSQRPAFDTEPLPEDSHAKRHGKTDSSGESTRCTTAAEHVAAAERKRRPIRE